MPKLIRAVLHLYYNFFFFSVSLDERENVCHTSGLQAFNDR
jgi:hypothetical protein